VSSESFGGAKLLCARSGAVLGLKPRFFNSIGDAHAFRLVAYGLAGVTARAKDDWPPRQITLVTRIGSRALDNIEEVVPLLNSTGLKFEWVQEMGALTFQEQVGVMANTGILVAIHGAGLTNVVFMPAHSVVIEVS
jgi:capsular polysaccharide biosynthesis protein